MDEGSKEEVEKVALELYSKCYIGHIPWNHWLKLAEFCIEFAKRKQKAMGTRA